MFTTRSTLRAHTAVALVAMTLSMSACEFFTTKPLAPDANLLTYVEVPNALVKYAPGLPPLLYARAGAPGPSLTTGSIMGDAVNGLRLSAQPLWPSAIDLAAVTPTAWVSDYGTGLQYIDDETTPQALPFAFSFYGQSYSSVFVSANGHISFGNPIQFKRTWNIPDGANVLAAPAYADWMPASRFSFPNLQKSRVYVNTVGEPGNRRFIVTWHDMRPCCSLSYPGSSFQLQLVERTGEIVFAFREMQMVVSNASTGIAADAQRYIRTASAQAVLALQGCVITYTPNATGYREANSCAPEPVNVPPVVHVGGPYAGVEGSAVSVDGSATDENGDALTYSWDLGDGTTMPGQAVAHTYVDNGAYPATLSVSDGEFVTVATTRVDVANAAPSLGALEGATRFIGEVYEVSLPLSDPGVLDAPWHYSIDWGDGSVERGDGTSLAEPIRGIHSYEAAGTYTVRVTLCDKDQGFANVVEAQVVVKIDEADIDIKPRDPNNRIHLKLGWDRYIPVAILGSERIDAGTIDLASVKLADVNVGHLQRGRSYEARGITNLTYLAAWLDINGDGRQDLLVAFDRKELTLLGELTPETTGLTLTGVTLGGRKFTGTDPVQVVR
jgi:hypothetical protein